MADTILRNRVEYISYSKEKQIKIIDQQLENLNIERIRSKSALIMEKSITDIQDSISQGNLTHRELTAFYLDRIRSYDAIDKGLNSVAEVSPHAMVEAEYADLNTNNSNLIKGIPILIKDNIHTDNMPTSGGTYAMRNFLPNENAEVVENLKSLGAVILGKSNLSELANYMDENMP